MNAVNPSAPDERKAISEEPTASGFFQALRDKSIYERLITPPGFKVLVIAIVLALLNGLLLFMTVEDASIAVDLATSLAFIVLFGLILGTWLGVIYGVVFARLATYALEVLERRVDKLLAQMPKRRREHINRANDNTRVGYRGTLYMFVYILSFPVLGSCLMLMVLHGYTYADSPPAVYESLLPTIRGFKVSLYISLASSIFLTGWTGTSILRIWHRIRTLEKQFDAAALSADIHAHVSIVGHINRAHMQTVKFVTGVF